VDGVSVFPKEVLKKASLRDGWIEGRRIAGGVVVLDSGKTLFLNFGSRARAEQYFTQKLVQGLPNAQIKSF